MPEVLLTSIPIDELAAKIVDLMGVAVTTAEKPPAKVEPKFLSRSEAAALMRVTLGTLSNWQRSGKVKAYKINRRVLFRQEDLEKALTPVRG